MAKYSYEFKKKVVQAYLDGKGGYDYLVREFGLKTSSQVRRWVDAYKTFGNEGLLRSRKNNNYTFEFKLHIVELYLTSELSCRELALPFGIYNSQLLSKWVNDYRIAGPDALRPRKRGRRPKMVKPKKINPSKDEDQDSNLEYLQQLEDENLKLRIENAYLKELRRLRLEGKPQKEKRESSTASEDHSN